MAIYYRSNRRGIDFSIVEPIWGERGDTDRDTTVVSYNFFHSMTSSFFFSFHLLNFIQLIQMKDIR